MSQVVQVGGPRRTPRSRGPGFRGIVPGAGGTATVAFGASRRARPWRHAKPKKKKAHVPRQVRSNNLDCWNAFHPAHLALPRAVGEYTVTRGTRQIKTSDKLILIGTWQHSHDGTLANATGVGYGRNWSDVVALGCDDLSKQPAESAWFVYKMPLLSSGLGANCQVCPSAVSVQIMNGNSLQLTNGMTYIGKSTVQTAYAGETNMTGDDIGQNFVSFMSPRMCAAAKLALRGIHVDAHPLNMNRLSDFTQIYRGFPHASASAASPGHQAWPLNLTPTGFTPIVIFNPDGIELSLLVCQEYRTRFELFNPACASHKFHPPSSDRSWADNIKKACDIGSGALDIADVVAKSGLLQQATKLLPVLGG